MIKTLSTFHLRAVLFLSVLCGFSARGIGSVYPESIQSALDEVSARCPTTYPDRVVPLPEPGYLEGKSQQQLLDMATTWNPALRAAVNRELASRADAVMPVIKKMLESEDSDERQLAAEVTHAIIKYRIENWKESFPEEPRWRVAQAKVREQYSYLIPLLISLCKDRVRATRESAVRSLGELQARQKDVSEAILRLFSDPDEYLAQQAIYTLSTYVGFEGVDQDTLFDAFSAGMKQPLPAARGTIVKLISQQDTAFQMRCVPLLTGHLDWVPRRDTMAANSGQVESIGLLTALEEESLIEHIPFVMNKKHRHHRAYFEAAVNAAAAFGPKAKKLVPLLLKSQQECRKEIEELELNGIDRRNKTRFEQLMKRQEALRKAMNEIALPVLLKSQRECSKELEELETQGVDRRNNPRIEKLHKRQEALRKAIEHVSE